MTNYISVFTRDFSLPWLQIWYTGEAQTPKPWNGQVNPLFPYIVFVRHDETITSYYDPQGLSWSRQGIFREIQKDSRFLTSVYAQVTDGLIPIHALLKQRALRTQAELLHFFELFSELYPWLEAMWEVGEAEEEEVGHLDVHILRELKASVVTLTDDMDNLIRQSLQTLLPTAAEYAHVLTLDEIRSGELPTTVVLRNRDAGFIYTDNQLYAASELSMVEKRYHIALERAVVPKAVRVIVGKTAARGVGSGSVRRIMSYAQIADFREGEVLVSPMTMPDFLPAMKKASAIVTDEGGMTCHAAILARELKKPCVVGTKIASLVLHTGDRVSVDADAGTVTILK